MGRPHPKARANHPATTSAPIGPDASLTRERNVDAVARGAPPQARAVAERSIEAELVRAVGARLHSLSAIAVIAPKRVVVDLPGKGTIETTAETRATLTLSAQKIALEFSPALFFDVALLRNTELSTIELDFATSSIRVGFGGVSGIGFGDPRDTIAERLTELAAGLVAGTPVSRSGYNPFLDPDIRRTWALLASNWERAGSSGSQRLSLTELSRIGVRASLVLGSGFRSKLDSAEVLLVQNTYVVLGIHKGQMTSPDDLRPDHVTVELTPGMQVSSGDVVVRISRAAIHRGGRVDIDPSGELPPRRDLELVGRSKIYSPTKAVIAQQIMDAASAALGRFILANRHAVPGVDLLDIAVHLDEAPPRLRKR